MGLGSPSEDFQANRFTRPAEAGRLSNPRLNAGTIERALFADIISRISFCGRIVGVNRRGVPTPIGGPSH
jgi:hypothetical protein